VLTLIVDFGKRDSSHVASGGRRCWGRPSDLPDLCLGNAWAVVSGKTSHRYKRRSGPGRVRAQTPGIAKTGRQVVEEMAATSKDPKERAEAQEILKRFDEQIKKLQEDVRPCHATEKCVDHQDNGRRVRWAIRRCHWPSCLTPP